MFSVVTSTLLLIICNDHGNSTIIPSPSPDDRTTKPDTDHSHDWKEEYIKNIEFRAHESILTGREELFRSDCNCVWAYQYSQRCDGELSSMSNCEKVCCAGHSARGQFVWRYREMVAPTRAKALRMLVGVASSGKTMGTRVSSIMRTWGRKDVLPENVRIRFFFGEDAKDEVTSYLKVHGIPQEMAVFLPGMKDDQYPPVRKNMAMLNWLQTHMLRSEGDKWDWVFKVDDDTLVNWERITSLLTEFSPQSQSLYLGQQGIGRPEDFGKLGLMKPFCMGGPGYVMSASLLRNMPEGAFPNCAEDHSQKEDNRWHSDVMAGLCIYEHERLGCWDRNADMMVREMDHEHKYFFHNVDGNMVNPRHAANMYSLHPFKEIGSMVSLFEKMNDL